MGINRKRKRLQEKEKYKKFVSEWKLEKKYNSRLKTKPTFSQWKQLVKTNMEATPEQVVDHAENLSWDDE